MQYLYVLVSSPKDVYYEQFLLSVASLRLLMPNADTVLLCDSKTNESLVGKRSCHKDLVSKTVSVDPPLSMPQVEVSRWLKTSMRRHIKGDFLFIDCDTIVTKDLSSIAKSGIKLGACLDKHSLIDEHAKGKNIVGADKRLGFTSHLSNRHINSGVIFCADVPETHKVFDRWHELWQFGNSRNTVRDQPSFNMAVYENPLSFSELDGTWNCQILYNGLPFLSDAKIIHYFASDMTRRESPFLLASKEILGEIKRTGVIPTELLKNPKAAFVPEARIIAGKEMLHVVNSSFFEALVLMRKKAPGLFCFLNFFAETTKKAVKFVAVKTDKKTGGIKYYN